MKQRREQQKTLMLHLESAPPFADAAFAQNNYLPAPAQRIHHYRPFFERNPHRRSLPMGAAKVEPAAICASLNHLGATESLLSCVRRRGVHRSEVVLRLIMPGGNQNAVWASRLQRHL